MLELRRLSYLVIVAKRLSYTQAALDLGLSQSALTRAIQSLEREIGMRLFDRDQSGVRLTQQGRWVVAKAEVLLTHATDFANQLAFAAKGAEGHIRCGFTGLAAHLLLPAILPTRVTDVPRFTHEILVRDTEPLYLMLAQGQIEFLVCSELNSIWSIPDVMPVKIQSLGTLPIGLIARSGHPLADGNPTKDRFPILISSPHSISDKLTAHIRDLFGEVIQVIEDIGIILSLVKKTDALWLSCPLVAASEIADGSLWEVPLPNDLQSQTFELFVYSLARRSPSPASLEIISAISQRMEVFGGKDHACAARGR